MNCAECNAVVDLAAGAKIGFRESCDACGQDLHTCHNCIYFDTSAYNECRESSADRVLAKERSNHCDYFSPGEQTGGEGAGKRSAALSNLDALFKKS